MFKLSKGYGITRLQIGPWVWFWKNRHFKSYQQAMVVPIKAKQLALEEADSLPSVIPGQVEANRLARHKRARKTTAA